MFDVGVSVSVDESCDRARGRINSVKFARCRRKVPTQGGVRWRVLVQWQWRFPVPSPSPRSQVPW